MDPQVVVGVTGASGAAYARRLLEVLCDGGANVHLVISPHGRQLLAEELGLVDPSPNGLVGAERAERLTSYGYRDVGAVLASGSFLTNGMIICPCSGNTLADVAAGSGDNLITRAAAVHLKEGRRLILVPREMPISQIEIANMLRISQAGGTICPAAPGFYMKPTSVDDLVDFVAGKLCDRVGVGHGLDVRWKQKPRPPAV